MNGDHMAAAGLAALLIILLFWFICWTHVPIGDKEARLSPKVQRHLRRKIYPDRLSRDRAPYGESRGVVRLRASIWIPQFGPFEAHTAREDITIPGVEVIQDGEEVIIRFIGEQYPQ